jgi:hypothetical protein
MDFKETLQECSSMGRVVHKSGDIYFTHGFRGIILGVFQCVWRCAQVWRFYSGHGIQRKHSRSVPMCSEMCTSPEYFTPDMYSGGITAGVFQCVWRCIQVRSVLLRTWTSRKHSRSVPVCLEMCTSPEILLQTWNSEETLQECSNVYKSGVFYSRHVLWRNHCRSVPVCPEMRTSPECFTPDMDFKETLKECSSVSGDVHKSGDSTPDMEFRGNTPGVFQCVHRCVQVWSILLQTCTLEESLQECSSVSGDAYKSGVFYSGQGLQGNTPGVFQCVWRCAQVRRFYSGHGIQRKHFRSVPMCPEMCTSPECFTPDMYFGGITPDVFQHVQRCAQVQRVVLWTCASEESLQECSSVSGDVYKSGVFYSGHGLQGNTPGVFQHVHRCAQVQRSLLRTCTADELVWQCSSVSGNVHKSGGFHSGLLLWINTS